jgi:hypothetical protein
MNTSKKNTMLVVLLVVQVALIGFLYRPGRNATPVAANLFKGLTPDQVTAMTITDDQGKSINLVKKGSWQITPGDFPADQAKIEGLLKRFAGMKSSRLVSQTNSSHLRLKVADTDFNRKIELQQGDKKSIFFLGTAPSSKSIHLRLDGAKEVYQVNGLSAWEVLADKESWWQTKYLSESGDKLTGLTIANGSGTIGLAKDGKKGWQLKGSPDVALDADRAESLVNSASDITIASYLAKEFVPPTAKPIATITYQTKDGSTTLDIWAKEKKEDTDQLVKASNSPLYAKAKEYVVKGLLEAKLDSLKAKPATAAATPEATKAPAAPAPPQAAAPAGH